MNTKKHKYVNALILGVLVIAASFSIGFYFSQPQTNALANSEPAQQPSPQLLIEPTILPTTNHSLLSRTKNEITVDITSTRIVDSGIEIGICYTAPDNGEWRPMPGHLIFGSYDVLPNEIEFLPEEKIADGMNTGVRCAFVRYLIEDLDAISTPIQFSLLRFYAPGREMYTPCEEVLQRLGSNPKARAYGLKARCVESSDGNISVTLVDHAASIAKDKANKTLNEIAKGEIVGPWEFIIMEVQK